MYVRCINGQPAHIDPLAIYKVYLKVQDGRPFVDVEWCLIDAPKCFETLGGAGTLLDTDTVIYQDESVKDPKVIQGSDYWWAKTDDLVEFIPDTNKESIVLLKKT
jgi:hypothetical protein